LTAGPEHIERLAENVAMQQSLGVNTRVISVGELKELEPGVSTEGIVGAAYEPDSGYADPYSTTVALANRAEELGAEILTGTAVRSILVEQGRVTGAETDAGRVRAAAVVLAAGPWTVQLAGALGVELPIVPCRVQVCLFQRAPGFDHDQVFIDSTLGVYTRPEGEDLMLVGSVETDEAKAGVEDPDHFQRVADFDAVERYSEELMRRFPAMQGGGFVNGYASLYDVTPDWQPILDRLPGIEGLYCAAGSSGHGFKLAPLVGRIMAELVTTRGARGDDADFFRFDRFARGRRADGGYAHKILG
jgi:sarcosine oxidase subunit beta